MGADFVGGKTKALCTTQPQHSPLPVLEHDGFDHVQCEQTFEYLGCDIKFEGDCTIKLISNINSARKAFPGLAALTVWYVQELSLSTKMFVFRANVITTLLYGCETWITTFQTRRKLRGFIMMCLRVISRVTRWQQQLRHVHSDMLRAWLGVPDVVGLITQAQLRWLGHVARMPVHRLPKRITSAFLPDSIGTQRPPGRL